MRDCILMQRRCIAENSISGRNLFTKFPVSAIISIRESNCQELPVKFDNTHSAYLSEKGGEQYE